MRCAARQQVHHQDAANDLCPVARLCQPQPDMRRKEILEKLLGPRPDTLNVLPTGQATADLGGAAVNRANLYRSIGKPRGR